MLKLILCIGAKVLNIIGITCIHTLLQVTPYNFSYVFIKSQASFSSVKLRA
ncbi:Uncharacterised protein [Segatella copri]|nr:Uncharacterised protein [Segatella copri]